MFHPKILTSFILFLDLEIFLDDGLNLDDENDDGINPDPQTDGEGPSNNYTSEGYISNKNGIVNKSQAVR